MLYVNPGFAELFENVNGKTVDKYNNPYFYNTSFADNTYNVATPNCKEIYVKCRLYYADGVASIYTLTSSPRKPIGFQILSPGYYFRAQHYSDWDNLSPGVGYAYGDTEYEILIHVSLDVPSIVEFYINGKLAGSFKENFEGLSSIPGVLFYGGNANTLFRNVIVADYDISDYRIAQAKVKSFKTDFEKQNDGSLKATAPGQSIQLMIDSADLSAEMKKNVANAEIVGVTVGAFNINYDASVVDTLKVSVNETEAETHTIANNIAGQILLKDPSTEKPWTLAGLTAETFKLTAAKR